MVVHRGPVYDDVLLAVSEVDDRLDAGAAVQHIGFAGLFASLPEAVRVGRTQHKVIHVVAVDIDHNQCVVGGQAVANGGAMHHDVRGGAGGAGDVVHTGNTLAAEIDVGRARVGAVSNWSRRVL